MPVGDFYWSTLLEGTLQPWPLRGAAGPMRELLRPVLSSYQLDCVVGSFFFFSRALLVKP